METKSRRHILQWMAFALLFSLLFSGCVTKSPEDLYTLPQFSEQNLQLQTLINQVLNAGAEYSAPVAGANRQAVQLEDLNGDGVKEAIAFFRSMGEDDHLKVYIFDVDAQGQYQEVAQITGEGSNIESITYTDLDGDGIKEVIVGWQILTGINLLSVYRLESESVSQLFSTDYAKYTVCHLSSGKGADICVFRSLGTEAESEAELYAVSANGEVTSSKASLSTTIASIDSVRAGFLADGKSALFVESTLQSRALVTDILTFRQHGVENITLDQTTGISDSTDRTYAVNCRDIDGDGIVEVPEPVSLGEDSTFWLLEWYSFDSAGNRTLVTTTYHNYQEEWYLEIPEEWYGRLSIRREDGISGERAIVFSYVTEDGTLEEFLAVYTLSGDNKEERAEYDGRFLLAAEGDVIYSAKILVGANWNALEINEGLVRQKFHIIYSEWMASVS